MTLHDHILVALESIRGNPLRSFLNMLGVIIGVLSVILLVSLGDGLRAYLANTFSRLGSNLIEVLPGKSERKGAPPPLNAPRKLTAADALFIRKKSQLLEAISPVLYRGGSVRFQDARRDLTVVGVGPDYLALRSMQMAGGRFISDEDVEGGHHVAIIGPTVLREVFGGANPLGMTIYVSDVPHRIVGLTSAKGSTFGYDWDDVVYLPVTTAMDLFNSEGVTQYLARSRDKGNTHAAMNELEELLSSRHNYTVDFTTRSQDDMLSTFNKIADTMTLVLLAIASISLLVGGIGIMNIMLVSVKERTREIGVRRAVGARRWDILLQFLVESVVISVLGGLLGLILAGLIIASVKKVMPDFPVELSLWIVGVAVGFSGVVGVVSGVVPARNAAAINVVDALRYE